MAGLLDGIFDSEGGRLGLGLLAAAGPRADGAGFGQRLQEAVGYTDQFKQQQFAQKHQAMQEQMHALQLQEAQQKQKEQEEYRNLVAQYAKPAMPAVPPIQGDALLPPHLQSGILPREGLPAVPPIFDRAGFGSALEAKDPVKGLAYQASIAKDDAPIKLSAGEQLFSGKASGYKPLLSVPKERVAPAAVQEYEYAKGQGYGGSLNDWLIAQKRAGASSTTVNMTDGQKGFENEMKLGGAFKQEPIYKDHAAVQSAFSQINGALAQGTPISDTAAATKIMKILDPGSVVRESELGMAMAAGGRMDRLQNYVKQSMDGTKLTPQQRADFGSLASELTAASAQTYNAKRSEYFQQGKDYGLNADRALGKPVDVPSATKRTADKKLSLAAPNGKTYTFNSLGEMNNFKMATGVK